MKRDLATEQLEGQATIAKVFARRLWATLARRTAATGLTIDEFFLGEVSTDVRRIIDPAFDAAQAIWERHRVFVEPCRVVLDDQPELYLAHWPDGTIRNLTRADLLMMGGQDPDQ